MDGTFHALFGPDIGATLALAILRANAAARMLARMQDITPEDLGLGQEPVVSVPEELDRWAALFATVEDDICPGHAALHARLAALAVTVS